MKHNCSYAVTATVFLASRFSYYMTPNMKQLLHPLYGTVNMPGCIVEQNLPDLITLLHLNKFFSMTLFFMIAGNLIFRLTKA